MVKSGRFNKRKHEVCDLAVNPDEAAVVRIMFEKYVHEGYGAQRIATYLNELGYRARTGKPWHHATIRNMLCNPTYTGVLRSGENHSPVMEELQIITPEMFQAAQNIRNARADAASQERRVPMNTRGKSLLAGNIFCGHCGARLALTTNGRSYPCKDDPNRVVKRVRYICYGKTRKQTECDGQTGYTAHILDGIVDQTVRGFFSRMKALPKNEVINVRYQEQMAERKKLFQNARMEHIKATNELTDLKAEVIKAIRGESSFGTDLLGTLIQEAEEKCAKIKQKYDDAKEDYERGQSVMDTISAQYDDIISWADLYDTTSMEAKKMIFSYLINRIEVSRGYRVKIDFNIDLEQFCMGAELQEVSAIV